MTVREEAEEVVAGVGEEAGEEEAAAVVVVGA